MRHCGGQGQSGTRERLFSVVVCVNKHPLGLDLHEKQERSFTVSHNNKNTFSGPVMSIVDHSPTTGVVTVIVILIAIAALGALILGCWCYLRLQRIGQSEDEESIVGEGETKEPFLLVQYSAKGPRVERKTKLTPNGTESHS
ncbi:stannin isoform X1 [Polyodon spathula]|nr:stannin isoform X1 [Polyodon spathula]